MWPKYDVDHMSFVCVNHMQFVCVNHIVIAVEYSFGDFWIVGVHESDTKDKWTKMIAVSQSGRSLGCRYTDGFVMLNETGLNSAWDSGDKAPSDAYSGHLPVTNAPN